MTSPHISDELPRLLTGEAARDEVLGAAEHLRHCEDCRQELVSTVVAHASLTSARRFAPEVIRAAGLAGDDVPAPAPLPDLSAVFAEVRAEAASTPSRRSRRPMLAVAAVAAGALIGGGAVAVVSATNNSGSPSGRRVALAAFDTGHTSATATIASNGRMRVDAASLPDLDARHRYEVWLTDAQRTRMQPVGWIGADGTAELTVPASLVSTFRAIEVSVQQVDAPSYDYSGTSVLRGSYG